jgi:ParB family chromosome partitioning protein
MSKQTKGGLGRGLSALLTSEEISLDDFDSKVLGSVAEVPINQIEANPFQPRTEFEKQALEELSESIRLHGIIQPITLRKMGYEKYQLISGERRTRAAILAGLTHLPAYIRVANDQDMLEMALIENIQRENLNAIEIAFSYKRLMDECDLKQEELGARVGKDRSTVSNYIRLLKLPTEIQAAIKNDELSMGHAKSIAGLKSELEQLELFHRILQEGLSVRATENLVKSHIGSKKNTKADKNPSKEADTFVKLLQSYQGEWKSNLTLKSSGDKHVLSVKIEDESQLEAFLQLLS